MKPQNVQICENCGESNALFEKNCNKCKHYLRASVINIDLWKTIWQLFENPKKALLNIICAEHKNFIIFLLVFISLKLYLTATITQSAFNLTLPNAEYFIYNVTLVSLIYIVTILLFVKIISVIINKKYRVRFKDNLSILVYSFIPSILSLFILTPVEYGIFGKHWFIYNPSPFLIKSNLANILSGLEILMLLWSVVLLYKAVKIQSNSILFSVLVILTLVILLAAEITFIPFILL